jgi:hypothetical protein
LPHSLRDEASFVGLFVDPFLPKKAFCPCNVILTEERAN